MFVSFDQRIALHVAAERGHVDTVKFLVGKDASDIYSKDNEGVSTGKSIVLKLILFPGTQLHT